MNLHAIFQLIQKHSLYKLQADSIRMHILASARAGSIEWPEISRRLKQDFPALLSFLEQSRGEYKKLAALNISRQKQGYQFICFGEELYPKSCYWMLDPPLTLSFLGHPAWQLGKSLAVVGSRDPAEESLLWMEQELAPAVERQQLHLVSGGARGVDQKAHSLAIRKNLPTSVVLPSGLGRIYPQNIQDWLEPVIEAGGCFVSEYDFEQPMRKYLFHHRNRLIAALSEVVLIVEARKRSGTLITAQQGLALSRPVLVVPGHPQDSHFGGSLELLFEGGTLVRDAQDLDIILDSEFGYPNPRSIGLGGIQ